MTFVVPFDGSTLAETALVRAVEFARVLEERVVAVTVVPKDNETYARARDWLGDDEEFDVERVVSRVHERVTDLAPGADFRHFLVDRRAGAGTIAKHVRRLAVQEEASMVFVGSENAGHIVSEVGSVGGTVAAGGEYDVVIVRQPAPSRVRVVRERSPYRHEASGVRLSDEEDEEDEE